MSKKRKHSRRKQNPRQKRGYWLSDDPPQPLASGHYLPVDPRLTEITCPDCGAHWEAPSRQRQPGKGGALNHAPTCPIGMGYADAGHEDRAWFEAHPGETERLRLPTMAEIQAILLATGQALPDMPMGVSYEPSGEVKVCKVSGDLRLRDFSGVVLLAAPVLEPPADGDAGYDDDEFDESNQRWFREHGRP